MRAKASRHPHKYDPISVVRCIDFGDCGGPQPPAGEQVARVPLRNRDLTSAVRADGRQLLWQPATVRLATDRACRVYPLGDLRGLVPIPHVALQDMAIREASPLGHHSTLPPAVVAAWVCQESDPSAPPKPRLLDRVRHAIETRHYSRRTEKAWLS